MTTALIQVPYDSGHHGARMGRGPLHLMEAGAQDRLRRAGANPVPARIHTDHALPTEIGTGFELCGKLAGEVGRARRDGAFPLVLAGNCLTSVGTVAGLSDVPRLGMIWLDAHGDLNTPETSISGFLDGMPAAICAGWCFRAAAKAVPGFSALPEAQVLHAGGRAWDAGERALFEGSEMHEVPAADWRERGLLAVEPALSQLARSVDAVYLHIDQDVQDAEIARANGHAVAGGPTPDQVHAAVRRIMEQVPVAAAALTALDPAFDQNGTATDSALTLMAMLAGERPGAA